MQTTLDVSRNIALFGYGLVFFVMGWSIALQSRRYSRLELALSLKWLAVFGVTHGFYEWGNLFIPTRGVLLEQPGVRALYLIQLILLGVSFSFLFEFGLDLLLPIKSASSLHTLTIGLLVGWLFLIFFILLPLIPDLVAWRNTADAIARYFIGFPAGVLSAIGLRNQINRKIVPLNVPHIVRTLRVAGLALIAYATLAELIPPPLDSFPWRIINTITFNQILGVLQLLFGLLAGLILAITIIRALEVFELETERLIESMEQQQILSAERSRIGRELHDGAIQKIYTAGLLIQSAARISDPEKPVKSRLDEAVKVIEDALIDLRNNLGGLSEEPGDETLLDGLRQLENEPRFHSLFDISIDTGNLRSDPFSSRRASHILAIVNEALSNIARHAHAKKVTITTIHEADRLVLSVEDDGSGLPPNIQEGYGLRNMRDRARLLGGQIEICSENGKCTSVRLNIPWRDER